ncbi:MAG: hypothetical protein AB7H48_01495 [Parachlamydiales bacterium]|nr:hypothetical protein [Halobacteriovoraceae bacterium]
MKLEKNWEGKLEQYLKEACFSGERIILEGEEGIKAALVPIEDLEVLEEIEGENLTFFH